MGASLGPDPPRLEHDACGRGAVALRQKEDHARERLFEYRLLSDQRAGGELIAAIRVTSKERRRPPV